MGKKKEEKKQKTGSPTTTLIVALISSIIFFLIGVEVGKEYAIREGIAPVVEHVKQPLPGESIIPPQENGKEKTQEKVDINFYEQLMKEGDQELNEEPEGKKKQTAVKKKNDKSPKKEEKAAKKAEPSKRKTAASQGAYALQVAAFKEKSRALRMAEMLRKEGFTPHIIPVSIPGKPGTYYRIWVGYYRNLTEASQARRRMIQNHTLRISRATIVKR